MVLDIRINHIVARCRDGGIGYKGGLLFKAPEDLSHFKELTLGHPVIMGRTTFESIGKPLPNRINIVVSAHMPLYLREHDITLVDSLSLAYSYARIAAARHRVKDMFIIGGGKIYEQTYDACQRVYLTTFDAAPFSDCAYRFDPRNWTKCRTVCEVKENSEKRIPPFSIEQYDRRGTLL